MLILQPEENWCFGLVLEVKVENSSASSPAEIYIRALSLEILDYTPCAQEEEKDAET